MRSVQVACGLMLREHVWGPMQEIERKEHDPVARLVDSRAQGIEVGDAILVLDNDFAIDDSRLTRESRDSLDYPRGRSNPFHAGRRP